MRHIFKNSILVVLSYSLALSTPVVAKPKDNFVVVKNYVNGGGKKTFKGLIEKMEGELPVTFYDQALKKTRGASGMQWFQAAKMANNYLYLRFNNSKIFVRVTEEKGKTVFYANGLKIHENEFRNIKSVQNKLLLAYFVGLPARKSSMLDFFSTNKAFAGGIQQPPEVVTGDGTTTDTVVNTCNLVGDDIARAVQENDIETAKEICESEKAIACNFPLGTCDKYTAAAIGGTNSTSFFKRNMGLILAIIAGLLMYLLSKRKNKKDPKPEEPAPPVEPVPLEPAPVDPVPVEVPEDTTGEGRDPNGGGCGGEGAQCGDGTTTVIDTTGSTSTESTPSAPPAEDTENIVVPVSNDPNYNGLDATVTPTSRAKTSSPKKQIKRK